MRAIVAVLAKFLVVTGTAWSGTTVDRSVPVSPGGEISIEVPLGSVRVIGWDQKAVRVQGTLGDAIDGLEIDRDQGDVTIEVDFMRHAERSAQADLVIHVPAKSDIYVEGIRTDIEIRDIRGDVAVETVSGDVDLSVVAGEVRIESIAGTIRAEGPIQDFRAESASGDIEVIGVKSRAFIEAVSGTVRVTGSHLTEGALSTASGNIVFQGTLAREGELAVESLNGTVELRLPPDVSADFDIETFNGAIEVGFEGVRVERSSVGPGRSAQFTSGGGGFSVQVETFNGSCIIVKE